MHRVDVSTAKPPCRFSRTRGRMVKPDYGPGDWAQAPVAELSDGHLANKVARRAPEPLGDGGGLELRSQFRAP